MNPYDMPATIPKEECQQETKPPCKIKTCLQGMCKSLAEAPLLTKIVTGISISAYICTLFNGRFGKTFISHPAAVFFETEVYRIITGNFIVSQLYNLALVLIIWVPKVTKYEKSIGTIRYCFLFLVNTIAIQLLYSTITVIASYYVRNFTYYHSENMYYIYSVGILPYAFMELTMDYLANRKNSAKILCLPCKFHPLIFPVIALSITIICNSYNFLQFIVAILYGVLYYYLLREKMYFSEETISKYENHALFGWMSRKIGFVSLKDAEKYNQEQIDLERSIVNYRE